MNKKFSIHLIDDNEAFKQLVADTLFPGTGIDLIDYHYFQTVGEAIAFYVAQHEFPEIALVDIQFNELSKDKFPDSERGDTKGLELIRFIAENTRKTKIFAFTGQGGKDEVVDELARLDFFDNTLEKTSVTWAPRVRYELQKSAKKILKNIAYNFRNELKSLPATFQDFEVANTGFTVPCLLAGWGDLREKPLVVVQNILSPILREEITKIAFRGVWANADSPERRSLEQYRNLNRIDYERELKAINKMAFNLLIEFIAISEKDDFGETEVKLSHQFTQQNFCVTSTIDITPNALKHKLIGRRGIAAFTHYYRDGGLSLNNCAVLLRDRVLPLIEPLFLDKNGNPLLTRKDENGKPLKKEDGNTLIRKDKDGKPVQLTKKEKEDMVAHRTSSIINTALGLASAGGRNILIDDDYLLPEERAFLFLVGDLEGETYAEHFANFLANIIKKEKELRNYFPGQEVQNMSELKRFFDNVRFNRPEEEKELLERFFKSEYLINVPEGKRQAIFHLFDIPV